MDGFRFDLASVMCRDRLGQPLESPPIVREIAMDPILSKVRCAFPSTASTACPLFHHMKPTIEGLACVEHISKDLYRSVQILSRIFGGRQAHIRQQRIRDELDNG